MNMLKKAIYSTIVALLVVPNLVVGQGKNDSTNNKVRFAAIPLINYNRTQGIIVGGMTSAFYKVNKKDTISPVSNTMFLGVYTAENSWAAGVAQQLYLHEDRWRIRGTVIKGDVYLQYFNGDPDNNVGQYEDYANEATTVTGQIQRKLWKRLYGGLYGEYNSTTTYFQAYSDSLDERTLNNLGYMFSQDTRDDVYYPTKGVFMNYKNRFYGESIGSSNNFTRFELNYNQFFDLKKDQRHILVARLNLDITTGDVPFQGQAIVGGDDLRGYSQGQYRGNQVYALQSEYRWSFNRSRFGAVAFFGVASAVDSFSDIFNSALLPGGGVGVRFKAISSMNVNIGLDAGIGKNDYSITFRIGESFAR